MSLKQTIENEYKNALKSKDKNKISTYRLILSSIKDLDIVNRSGPNKKETDNEDIKKLLRKMVKQRAESIDIYKKNNRTDLLEVEQNEYDILTSFLPKQLSEEETKKICGDVISKIGASSLKDIEGQYMGLLKLSPIGWEQILLVLNSLPPCQADTLEMTSLLQLLVESGIKIEAVPISGRWCEIDNQSDLKVYETRLNSEKWLHDWRW